MPHKVQYDHTIPFISNFCWFWPFRRRQFVDFSDNYPFYPLEMNRSIIIIGAELSSILEKRKNDKLFEFCQLRSVIYKVLIFSWIPRKLGLSSTRPHSQYWSRNLFGWLRTRWLSEIRNEWMQFIVAPKKHRLISIGA